MKRKGLTLPEVLVILAIISIVIALLIPTVVGCRTSSGTADADVRQAAETKQRLAEADRQIGMPDITRFNERKLAKDILEMRDKEITTYCYIVNMHGQLIFLGEAIGYGLPYSVQYTNPMQVRVESNAAAAGDIPYTLPQADPNGLFMPDGLSATWVMLKSPSGEVKPVYVEPEIIVSPFPLHSAEVKAEIEL